MKAILAGESPAAFIRVLKRLGQASLGEIIGRAVNLILPFAIFAIHDISSATDTFFLAIATAYFVQGSITNAVVSVQVPSLVLDSEKRSLAAFLPWVLLAGVMSAVVASYLVTSSPNDHAYLISITSVAMASCAGLLAAPAIAILNADHRYSLPGLTWGLRFFPLAAYIVWSPATPALHLLLAGLALADSVRSAILIRAASYRLSVRQNVMGFSFPLDALLLLIGMAVAGLTPLGIRWLASLGEAGAVSVYELADRIYASIASLATIGISNVLLVYLSRASETDDAQKAWKLSLYLGSLWSVLWLGILLLVWAAFPLLLNILPNQTNETLAPVRSVFLYLSMGIPGFILALILSRRIISLGLTRFLLPIAICGLVVSIAVGALMSSYLGTEGLALGITVSQYIAAGLMAITLRKRKIADTRH